MTSRTSTRTTFSKIDWGNYSDEPIDKPIDKFLSVNYFPETEERWTKFVAYAIYQAMMLTEDGSKEHHEQLVELLRTLHPITLYDVWVKDYIYSDAMRGLTTIHPTMYGHLNVLAETERPKAAVIVTDSIFCFLNGKRSRTAYGPFEEIRLAFGVDRNDVEIKIVWGADLPRLICEYNDAVARVKAKAQFRMRDPERDAPRIYGLIWWNGNELVGRNGICDYELPWGHEMANPDRSGAEARILGTVKRLSRCKHISDEFVCLCGVRSYIFEMPSYVDEFWDKIYEVIDELGIPRFEPSNLVFQSDRVDRWHLRRTQENVDKFVNYVVSTVNLFIVPVPEFVLPCQHRQRFPRGNCRIESCSALQVQMGRRWWRSYAEQHCYFACGWRMTKERIARHKQPIGKSRQFTVEEIQAASPFDTNDVSVDKLKASVNLEGEDPQELLQFLNATADDDLPQKEGTLIGNVDDIVDEAGVTAKLTVGEPIVEESVEDTVMEEEKPFLEPEKTPTGVTALSREEEQQMMQVEAQVLDVLDDLQTTNTVETANVPISNSMKDSEFNVAVDIDDDEDPYGGTSAPSTSRAPIPRRRGKGARDTCPGSRN